MRGNQPITIRGLATAAVLALVGCGGTGTQTDTDAPIVQIINPAAGATISGTITFSADAEDSFGVKAVRFYIDGVQVDEDITSPYETIWNTLGGADGAHSLRVEAEDVSGNKRGAQVNVTVDNQKQ